MSTRNIVLIIAAIALVLLGLLGSAYLSNARNKPATDQPVSDNATESTLKVEDATSIESELDAIDVNDTDLEQSTTQTEAEIQAIN